jgi:serine-type D-Ala-D-Ala carboxypeptidase/endopeptidase (penicillin-binding protein 4)
MMKSGVLFSFLFIANLAFAQSLNQKIATAYGPLENDPQLKYGLSSLTVANAATGEILFSKNGRSGLAPASTLKTLTSATAFHILGQDFKWETRLAYNGTIKNGILNGDLLITGSGDPTLGSDRYSSTKPELILSKWLAAVKEAGIKKVEGRIIADDSLFGTQITPLGWIWQDIGNYYGAGATSLSWLENEMGIRFKAGSNVGDKAPFIDQSPSISGLKIINEVTTGSAGSGDNVYAYSAPYTDVVYLRGTYGIDLNKTIKISIPDPPLLLANTLKNKLKEAGIISSAATTHRLLKAEGKTINPAVKTIATHQSPALPQIVYWLNQKSLNLYAENLLKTIAIRQNKEGNFENGVDVIKTFWKDKLMIDPNSLNILDGSGLSPENRITTESLVKILQSIKKENWFNDFHESLPVYNNIKMKSGSIRNALCYAGYHQTSDGIPLVFSIITNNYSGSTSAIKQKIFKVLDVLK